MRSGHPDPVHSTGRITGCPSFSTLEMGLATRQVACSPLVGELTSLSRRKDPGTVHLPPKVVKKNQTSASTPKRIGRWYEGVPPKDLKSPSTSERASQKLLTSGRQTQEPKAGPRPSGPHRGHSRARQAHTWLRGRVRARASQKTCAAYPIAGSLSLSLSLSIYIYIYIVYVYIIYIYIYVYIYMYIMYPCIHIMYIYI